MNAAVAAVVSIAMVLVYGALLVRRVGAWRRYRDNRARRELLASIALFVVALGAALSSASSIAQIGEVGIRRALAGLAFGSFLAAGVLFLIEHDEERT